MEDLLNSLNKAAAVDAARIAGVSISEDVLKEAASDVERSLRTVNSDIFAGMKLNFEETGAKLDNGAREIPLSRITEDLRLGDISSFFQDLGGPEFRVSSELRTTFEDYVKTLPDSVATSEINDIRSVSSKFDNLPTPSSQSELDELVSQNKELKSQLKDIQGKIDDMNASGKKSGSNVKWAVFTLVGGFTLYEIIKHHQDQMSGCWQVHKDSSGAVVKCKVLPYSCSSDTNNPQLCSSFDKPTTSTGDYCAEKNGNCSKFCDCSQVACTPDTTYRCVDASFWDAMADIGYSVGTIGDSFLDNLLNLVKANWVQMLVIFFVILFAIWFLMKTI